SPTPAEQVCFHSRTEARQLLSIDQLNLDRSCPLRRGGSARHRGDRDNIFLGFWGCVFEHHEDLWIATPPQVVMVETEPMGPPECHSNPRTGASPRPRLPRDEKAISDGIRPGRRMVRTADGFSTRADFVPVGYAGLPPAADQEARSLGAAFCDPGS